MRRNCRWSVRELENQIGIGTAVKIPAAR